MPSDHAGAKRHLLIRKTILAGCLSTAPFLPAPSIACNATGDVCELTLDAGSVHTSSQGMAVTAPSGDEPADRGSDLILRDQGAVFNMDPAAAGGTPALYSGVMYTTSVGGEGHDEGDAGDGGDLQMSSAGQVKLVVGDSDNLNQTAAVIYAQSRGGNGTTDNDNNNSDGGDGGSGGAITIETQESGRYEVAGKITADTSGVYAGSVGGIGGEQNSSLWSNQKGGRGGDGGDVRINNRASFIFSGDALAGSEGGELDITGESMVSVLRAVSIGSGGGQYNGDAGGGGNVTIEHHGGLLQLRADADSAATVYGIRAKSEGAEGFESKDDSDAGGMGGSAGAVRVMVKSDIDLDVAQASGAAIYAASQAGKGGLGPGGNSGGRGGDGGDVQVELASADRPYTIRTTGASTFGILARSNGGYGGDGDDQLALAGQAGGGGFGGNGGAVEVAIGQDATIITSGKLSSGVVAWSLGGGGGAGSEYTNVLGGAGGKGGDGGHSGEVSVNNAGAITTLGDQAFGIDAQSNSGGGGAGGVSNGLLVEIGGDGGIGGTAGSVSLDNSGVIHTSGYGSMGMSAQANGGGGGNGAAAGGVIAVGGNPGEAQDDANGGLVTVINSGTIITEGDAAPGISAQSIGGGGGNASGVKGIFAVGGQGEAGGDGDNVIFASDLGTIQTSGDFSYGVIAQSTGGGGGNGGSVLSLDAGVSFGIGGTGDAAGNGGFIQFSGGAPAVIATAGDHAHGILAQSIGGGGGAGGDAQSYLLDVLTMSVGGSGSSGGDGGDMLFEWENLQLSTSGAASRGLVLQSLGGGGGTGGGVTAAGVSAIAQLSASVGGNGGRGGDGGAITAKVVSSSISTSGPALSDGDDYDEHPDDASAIVAQSIGGGGGIAGDVSDQSLLVGIALPPVGTAPAFKVGIAVGGKGGAGGDGGSVSLDIRDSAVSTGGQFSNAVLAQSIGGGGGDSGSASIYSLSLVLGIESLNLQSEAAVGGQCADGADSCGGGDGGVVQLDIGDSDAGRATVLKTGSDYSNAILAQSIGGGGGDGGSANAYAYSLSTGATLSFTPLVTVGSQGGDGGDGNRVTVNTGNDVQIATAGSGARGIVAQSLGGGGGTGQGTSVYLGAEGEVFEVASVGLTLDVGVGMKGGQGGAGGEVELSNKAAISTAGRDSDGVLLQSIGGGGGIGGSMGADEGDTLAVVSNAIKQVLDHNPLSLTGQLAVKVGGQGGSGGQGGNATLHQSGPVRTQGDYADGLIVQSIGGGGGIGGGSTSETHLNWLDVNIAVGGQGGDGGNGGQASVNLEDEAAIRTEGRRAHAVLVQSIGGGGGQGGNGTLATKGRLQLGAGVGGTGGNANDGGIARFTSAGSNWIVTEGDGSDAVVLQSIGGGGGVGGLTMGVGKDYVGVSLSGTLSLGGSGGGGGNGGTVEVCSQGGCSPVKIATQGNLATALLAQSIGNGGGAGSLGDPSQEKKINANLDLLVGGSGGDGGNGGAVSIGGQYQIETVGHLSRGIVVQSIGGGGGVAGSEGSVSADVNEDAPGQLIVSMGNSGGGGGSGGNVTLDIDGTITTVGHDADGLVVQSLGAGGGLAGVGAEPIAAEAPPAASVSGSDGRAVELTMEVGGTGSAGDGGAIGSLDRHAHMAARVTTSGDFADAIVLQSIGGGGGQAAVPLIASAPVALELQVGGNFEGVEAGTSLPSGGDIVLGLDGSSDGSAAITTGYGANGVVLQSIGGGGGLAAVGAADGRGTVRVGGSHGASGSGGSLQLMPASWIDLYTGGDRAHGLVLQSIGGGGGIATVGGGTAGQGEFQLAVGGSVGGGGPVNLDTGGKFGTAGRGSLAVIAQSIGGGGGIAAAGDADKLSSVVLGGAETSGDGGEVRLTLENGSASTSGAGAHAVVAQSIGGGGGIVGDLSQGIELDKAGWALTEGSQIGNGGDVFVSIKNSVATSGPNAYGVIAQSIGGGGGLGGSALGGFAGSTDSGGAGVANRAGQVSVTIDGSVIASGEGGVGVFAQSDASPNNGGPVLMTINGTVQGGSGNGAGVWIAGNGTGESSMSLGENAQLSAASGIALRYDGHGSLATANHGVLVGNTLCSNDGECSIDNAATGKMSDATLYQADIRNDGEIIIGTPGRFGVLTVAGDYRQTPQGVLRTDVDFANMRAGRMLVQGDAHLDGRLELGSLSLLPYRELMVLDVQGRSSGSLNVRDTPIFDFDLRQVGREHRLSIIGADFRAGVDLPGNQSGVANHLQHIWDLGGSDTLAPLFAVLNRTAEHDLGAYSERLSDLSPGTTLAPAAQMTADIRRFSGSMMSCPAVPESGADGREQDCFWGRIARRNTDQDAADGYSGFSFDSTMYQVGGQREFRPGWFLGASAAYQDNRFSGDDGRADGKGDAGYLGVVLKHQSGPWVYAGALSGAYGSQDMDRRLAIDGFGRSADSRSDVYSFGARLRASRHIGLGNRWYLKPYVDLDAIYTRMPGYTESGDALALDVDGSDQFMLGLTPTLEIGGHLDLRNGAVMRPFAYAGVSFLSEDSWTTTARFNGAPAGSPGFHPSLPGDHVVGRFGVGVQVNTGSGLDFRLQYDGEVSSKAASHAGQLKAMYRF